MFSSAPMQGEMDMLNRRQALSLGVLAAPAVLPAGALAQAWRPSRPIRLVVPFAPGGSNDIVSRLIAEPASQTLGQPIVIESRAGAGSVIGSEHVARAAPDGYTLLINSAHATVPAIVERMPYDPVNDFVGLAVAGFSPHALVVNPRFPAQNAREMVERLRTNPGQYNIATAGLGSGVHLAAELLRSTQRLQAEVVHYRGGGPSVVALVAGEAQVGTPTMASSIGQIRGGGLRALCVLAESRTPALPDVPSATEAGMTGLVHEEFFPIVAPAATPPEIVSALAAAFQAAIRQNGARLTEMAGVTPRAGFETPDQVKTLMTEMVARYSAILREAGVPKQ